MEKLTAKEEEVLNFFWKKGPLFVKDIVEMYESPKPHFNTISTIVRTLEDKGYVGHTQHGKTYQYHAIVSEEDMGKKSISSIVGRYFKNSYLLLACGVNTAAYFSSGNAACNKSEFLPSV